MARTIYQIAPIDPGRQQGIGILLPMNKSAHSNNASLNNILGQTTNVGQNYNNTGTSGASVFALSYSTEEYVKQYFNQILKILKALLKILYLRQLIYGCHILIYLELMLYEM